MAESELKPLAVSREREKEIDNAADSKATNVRINLVVCKTRKVGLDVERERRVREGERSSDPSTLEKASKKLEVSTHGQQQWKWSQIGTNFLYREEERERGRNAVRAIAQ